ncbi:MAG: S8 family serine peptidase, partial [Blastocatellia bacterium]|nr:S8 family serine peptidase [Blastocatellia bacterium]
MSHKLRYLVVSLLSMMLVLSPLTAMRGVRASVVTRNSPPPQQVAAHKARTLLMRVAPDQMKHAESLLNNIASSHKLLRGQDSLLEVTLKEELDPATTLSNLRHLDNVIEWAEPNYLVRRAGLRSSRDAARTRPRRARETAASASVIALLDTGVDADHRDLRGATLGEEGWNFVAGNDDTADDNGHGTQVAGIIAREGGLRILPLKTLDETGTGTIAEAVEAIDYAIARQVAVINSSFGTPAYSRALREAIARAETAGIVVVAAAGNGGASLDDAPFYPASYRLPNLIS